MKTAGGSTSLDDIDADELMSVKEACRLLAMSHDTIERRCAAGHLTRWKDPVSGAVRLYRKEVMEYLNRGRM